MTWTLDLDFEARGVPGVVHVLVAENTEPERVGSVAAATGFPFCRATVEYEAEGYLSLLGWIQNVGQASPAGGVLEFELDPFVLFDGISIPFGMYGTRPELFDAPYRSDRAQSLTWLAHSFLCAAPSDPFAREIEAVAGFGWGFEIEAGRVAIGAPTPLSLRDWTAQLPLLRTSFPDWEFTAGQGWSAPG